MLRRPTSLNSSLMVACTVLALLCAPRLCRAEPPPPSPAGAYAQGKVRIALAGGMTSAFDHRYFALNAGVGYFVLDGLELGLGLEQWFGGGPSLTKVSPEARYILFFVPVAKPYLGAFYRHGFVGDDLDDLDTIGGRGGLFIGGGNVVFGLGVVGERVVSQCTQDCSAIYPEIALFATF